MLIQGFEDLGNPSVKIVSKFLLDQIDFNVLPPYHKEVMLYGATASRISHPTLSTTQLSSSRKKEALLIARDPKVFFQSRLNGLDLSYAFVDAFFKKDTHTIWVDNPSLKEEFAESLIQHLKKSKSLTKVLSFAVMLSKNSGRRDNQGTRQIINVLSDPSLRLRVLKYSLEEFGLSKSLSPILRRLSEGLPHSQLEKIKPLDKDREKWQDFLIKQQNNRLKERITAKSECSPRKKRM